MRGLFKRNSERREYRLASMILIAGAALAMLVTRKIELNKFCNWCRASTKHAESKK